MNTDLNDPQWARMAKALFGRRQTTDSRIFTASVMERIRQRASMPEDLAWLSFRRWAYPVLAGAIAGLLLTVNTTWSTASMESVLSIDQPSRSDVWLDSLEESQ